MTGKYPATRIYVADCAECEAPFVTQRPAMYCTKRCADRVHNRKRRGTPKTPCPRCGQLKPSGYKWCDDCRPEETRRLKRIQDRQRRLERKGALRDSTRYTLWEIAERDDFTCGVIGNDGCGLKVNIFLSSNARMGPTIDHVVPISVSMDDRRANVQLMHRACNEAKGAG